MFQEELLDLKSHTEHWTLSAGRTRELNSTPSSTWHLFNREFPEKASQRSDVSVHLWACLVTSCDMHPQSLSLFIKYVWHYRFHKSIKDTRIQNSYDHNWSELVCVCVCLNFTQSIWGTLNECRANRRLIWRPDWRLLCLWAAGGDQAGCRLFRNTHIKTRLSLWLRVVCVCARSARKMRRGLDLANGRTGLIQSQ